VSPVVRGMLLNLSHLKRLNIFQHITLLHRAPDTRTCCTRLLSFRQPGYRRHNSHLAAETESAEAIPSQEGSIQVQQELVTQPQVIELSDTQVGVTAAKEMDSEVHAIQSSVRRSLVGRRGDTACEQDILEAVEKAVREGRNVGVHGLSIVKKDGHWFVEEVGKVSLNKFAAVPAKRSDQNENVRRLLAKGRLLIKKTRIELAKASPVGSIEVVEGSQDPPRSLSMDSTLQRHVGHLFSHPAQAELDNKASLNWKYPDQNDSAETTIAPESILTGEATRPILLTFDAFDTLFTPKEPIGQQYCTISRKYGLDLDEKAVMSSFKTAFKDMSARLPNYGKGTQGMTPENWWTTLITNTLTPLLPETMPHLPYALPDELYTHFSTSAAYTLFPDVMPFLSLIGTSSYSASHWAPRRTMLGVVSNSDPRVRDILSSFHPPIPFTPSMFPPRYTPHSRHTHHSFGPAHFSFAALSYETGFEKPDPRAFDRALRLAQKSLDTLHPVARLTRTGSEMLQDVRNEFHCLHVGDDVNKDVLAALGAGWDVVLIDRKNPVPISTRTVSLAPPPAEGEKYLGQYKGYTALARASEKKSKSLVDVEVTVVNSLMGLQRVVTRGRLEGNGSRWNQVRKRVWVDPKSLPVRARKKVLRKDLKGRRIVDRGAGDGTSRLV
jgi:FMN phosphatase YigB (HAD superfamily)